MVWALRMSSLLQEDLAFNIAFLCAVVYTIVLVVLCF